MRMSLPATGAGVIALALTSSWAQPGLAGGDQVAPVTSARSQIDEPRLDERLGTKVRWEDSPAAAFERADREQKLVLLLHLSGEFDSTTLT